MREMESGDIRHEPPSVEIKVGMSIREAEYRLIKATLDYCGGNKRTAAKILGVCFKTIYNRLNEHE